MARYTGYKRPQNTTKALRQLFHYMGYHRWLLLVVAVLVLISTGVSVAGTYLLKPVINDFILPGDVKGLVFALAGMGIMYLCGALADGKDIPEGGGGYPAGSVCPCADSAAEIF